MATMAILSIEKTIYYINIYKFIISTLSKIYYSFPLPEGSFQHHIVAYDIAGSSKYFIFRSCLIFWSLSFWRISATTYVPRTLMSENIQVIDFSIILLWIILSNTSYANACLLSVRVGWNSILLFLL